MNINVQLFLFYQLDRDVFKLSTVNTYLIVLSDFVLEFFQKETRVDHLFNILIFVFFSHLFFKDLSTSINIWKKDFHELCNEFNIKRKSLIHCFFSMILCLSYCFSKRLRNFVIVKFVHERYRFIPWLDID